VKIGYRDTSCLVALAFDEPGSEEIARRLREYDELIASNLLEAEFLSALHREGVEGKTDLTEGIAWLLPDRPLGIEMGRVLAVRYVRGADLWHLATALFLAETPASVDFLTLDADQEAAAEALGFPTPLGGIEKLERLRSQGPEGGLASLAGGWDDSEELVRALEETPRRGSRPGPAPD